MKVENTRRKRHGEKFQKYYSTAIFEQKYEVEVFQWRKLVAGNYEWIKLQLGILAHFF